MIRSFFSSSSLLSVRMKNKVLGKDFHKFFYELMNPFPSPSAKDDEIQRLLLLKEKKVLLPSPLPHPWLCELKIAQIMPLFPPFKQQWISTLKNNFFFFLLTKLIGINESTLALRSIRIFIWAFLFSPLCDPEY